MKTLPTIIIISFFSAAAFAQAGALDSTFGGDGKVTTALGVGNDYANAVAVQSDGKIVAVGYSSNVTQNEFALVRYNSDGTLDTNFGASGKVTTAIGSSNDEAFSVAIQPDGKILAAGYSYNGTDNDFALVRYRTDGALDITFGTNGEVTTHISAEEDVAYSLAIQLDGKIIAVGYLVNSMDNDFALVRYKADGMLDSTFGTDGIVITDFASMDDAAFSVAIQADWKIVLAGFSNNGTVGDFALARYNSDGSLDTSFSADGKVTTAIGSNNDDAYSVAIQDDGKIVAAGISWNGTSDDFALARYNTDGTLDNSFGNNGKVTTSIGPKNDLAYSVAIEPDGKIIVTGNSFITNFTDCDFALARYNTDGSLDSSFSSNGIVTTSFGSAIDFPRSVAIQPDGKIIVAGFSFNGTDDFALARYLSGLALGIINFSSPQTSPLIYPNPIQQTETLEYTLTKNETLTIALHDANGKLVQSFITNENRTAGEHKEQLKMNENLPAGNYLLTLSNGSHNVSVKLVKQ